jgi:hypothetical protein
MGETTETERRVSSRWEKQEKGRGELALDGRNTERERRVSSRWEKQQKGRGELALDGRNKRMGQES